MLRIRDLVVEEDLAESGWERWRIVSRRRRSEEQSANGIKHKKR